MGRARTRGNPRSVSRDHDVIVLDRDREAGLQVWAIPVTSSKTARSARARRAQGRVKTGRQKILAASFFFQGERNLRWEDKRMQLDNHRTKMGHFNGVWQVI